jgi:hypothetical protein
LEGRSDALALPVLAKYQRHRPRQGQLDALERAVGRPRYPVAYRPEQWGALDDLDSAKSPEEDHLGLLDEPGNLARARCPVAIHLARWDALAFHRCSVVLLLLDMIPSFFSSFYFGCCLLVCFCVP